MELGDCTIRKKRRNHLFGAVHQTNGIVWTDGSSVYLTPFQSYTSQDKLWSKVGDFEQVNGLAWSSEQHIDSSHNSGTFSFLAILHNETVSVHRVDTVARELRFKHLKTIPAKVIDQGLLWHPIAPVLCLLTSSSAILYYEFTEKELQKCPLPQTQGKQKLSCGCWSSLGDILYLAMRDQVFGYQWQQFVKPFKISSMLHWYIPVAENPIGCMAPWGTDQILFTTEVSATQMCTSQLRLQGLDASDDNSDTSYLESVQNLSSKLNKPDPEFVSSQLFLYDLSGKGPCLMAHCKVAGLCPTLLVPLEEEQCVLIGSYTQKYLQVYMLTRNHLHRQKDLCLAEDERPWGIAPAPNNKLGERQNGILLLVGCTDPDKTQVFPGTSLKKVQMKLQFSPFPGNCQHIARIAHPAMKEPKFHSSSRSLDQEAIHRAKRFLFPPDEGQDNMNKYKTPSPHMNPPMPMPKLRPKSEQMASPVLETLRMPGHDRRANIQVVDSHDEASTSSSLGNTGAANIDTHVIRVLGELLRRGMLQVPTNHKPAQQGMYKPGMRELPAAPIPPTDAARSAPHIHQTAVEFTKTEPSLPESDTWCHCLKCQISEGYVPSPNRGVKEEAAQRIETDVSQSWSESTCSCRESVLKSIEEGYKSKEHSLDDLVDKISPIARDQRPPSKCLESTRLCGGSTARSTCSRASSYPSLMDAPTVTLVYSAQDGSPGSKKNFLLDNGCLKLQTVKEVFGLSLVGIVKGDLVVYVDESADGYIPLSFSPNSTLHITGVRTSSTPNSSIT